MPKVLDLPEVHVGRCIFNRPFRHMTDFNVGEIIPLMYDCNITPGDSVQIPIKALIRMQTPLYPVADDLVFDVSAWFVPDRLTWKHFKNFWGENDTTFWEEETKYEIPQIEAPEGGWAEHSLADYLGIPTKVSGISTSHMPFRAYSMIWSEFWRDENLKEPIFYNTDDTTLTGKNYNAATYDYTIDTQLGAKPALAAKRADYFTKSLPEPQKSEDIFVPLGESAPIVGTKPYNENLTDANIHDKKISIGTNSTLEANYIYGDDTRITNAYTGLAADLSNALGATVNQLRMAVALQRYAETIARSGSRYIEILAGVFGVKSSDARLQRPEFLGGRSYPISMAEIQNTAQSSGNQLGNVGGMSKTIINDYLCSKSFEEHGTLMVLGVVRIKRHTYPQGLPRMLTRKAQMDFYNRALDHIGEEKVRLDQIYAQGTDDDETAFGYQPAFEDMRLGMSYCSGNMRPNATLTLAAWNYADDYSEAPTLSSEWIDEDKTLVDRTLTISSDVSPQIFGDFLFEMKHARGMSMYGTPGFMDHM